MAKRRISDAELIERLQAFAEAIGRPPSQNEMDEEGPHAAKPYGDRFGSWNQALEAAGLETGTNKPTGRPPIPEDKLLSELTRLANELDGPLTERATDRYGKYSAKTYCKRFGSWNEALRVAGLDPFVEQNLSCETLIKELQEFASELGRTPTTDEMDQEGPYTSGPYKRVFGSWNQALKKADLEVNYVRKVSNEELIEYLRGLYDDLGRIPRKQDVRCRQEWSSGVYQNRFGTWNNALRTAGFEPNSRWQIPRSELLEEIRRLSKELGHTPTSKEMTIKGRFTAAPYFREFGTWQTALRATGTEYLEDYLQSDTQTIPFGRNWHKVREKIIRRDGRSCLRCGLERDEHREQFGRDLNVHHRIPRRRFYNDPESSVEEANTPSNLLTLCVQCHRRIERFPVQPRVD